MTIKRFSKISATTIIIVDGVPEPNFLLGLQCIMKNVYFNTSELCRHQFQFIALIFKKTEDRNRRGSISKSGFGVDGELKKHTFINASKSKSIYGSIKLSTSSSKWPEAINWYKKSLKVKWYQSNATFNPISSIYLCSQFS